ncbi:hypothetical protein FHU13_005143 [Methylobacterium sp. R2-1]|nr:hypothetical protein [Methylobacterium sp. R2-1]
MPPYIDRPFSLADLESNFAQITRYAAMNEHDRAIVRNAQQAIQRSRDLLEATKHQVPRLCERSDPRR